MASLMLAGSAAGAGAAAATRVFIIGGMRKKTGVPTSNTEHVKAAVNAVKKRHHLSGWTIEAPDDLRGSQIPSDVFSRIDSADLVIADVSKRSPNVYYELAHAHALGLPTILVARKATALPFYFTQTRLHVISNDVN